jgi:4a-hydroxytetrahydrobiopterin dehydratase
MERFIEQENKLKALYTFKDFSEAWAFVTQVAKLSEEANHHPDIQISYNRVELTLTTHDAGNTVTQKDIALARQIEAINTKE